MPLAFSEIAHRHCNVKVNRKKANFIDCDNKKKKRVSKCGFFYKVEKNKATICVSKNLLLVIIK